MICISGSQRLLTRHPDCHCNAAVSISVGAERAGHDLLLNYRLFGIDVIKMPPARICLRTDGLWRHTCFEAFLRGPLGEGYLELNLSPSTEWAAYRFSGYRAGMANADEIAPEISVSHLAESLELNARVNLAATADFADAASWHVGIAAVAEEANGQLSYWALAHPPGKPDFHHRDGFALALSQ
jgi:hypothetical protein